MSDESKSEAFELEAAVEAGLLGVEVDPTPNDHYTVAGVIAGKPTPETTATGTHVSDHAAGKPNDAKSIVAGIGSYSDDELAELANDKRKTVSGAAQAELERRAQGGDA